MPNFAFVGIIFNPNSTGAGKSKAENLAQRLREELPASTVELVPTEHAGHATDLAYEMAKFRDGPLIVSSSGDGGYNEVINGVLRAQLEHGTHPVCAVLPAGNANDHSNAVSEQPLFESIVEGKVVHFDVLRADIRSTNGEHRARFAHSYMGIGLTPAVAVELNRASLGRIKETLIVIKSLKEFQPVEIEVGSQRQVLDSLIFTNISRMAKYLTIAEDADPDDGLFEMVSFPYKNKPSLLWRLIKAASKGLKGVEARSQEFTVTKHMYFQCDGEVMELQAGDVVEVAIAPRLLSTLS